MKFLFLFICLLIFIGCSSEKNEGEQIADVTLNSNIENFEKWIEEATIEPTAVINLDSTKASFLGFNVETKKEKGGLIIFLNNQEINLVKLETLNEIWGKRDSLDYANFLSQIIIINTTTSCLFNLLILLAQV